MGECPLGELYAITFNNAQDVDAVHWYIMSQYGSASCRSWPPRGSGRACCARAVCCLSFQSQFIHKIDLLLFVAVKEHGALLTFAKSCIQGCLHVKQLFLLPVHRH